MRDLLGWYVPLGRWAGVQLRLHAFFILFAVVALHAASTDGSFWYAVAALGILFVSVLVHELGHCCAAWHVEGSAESVLIWPFGGLSDVQVPHEPKAELLAALAGPVVNLAVWAISALGIVVLQQDAGAVIALLHPLKPPMPVSGMSWMAGLELAAWINWLLFLVNVLLPAVPLDGGRMWRSVLWKKFGYRSAVVYVARAATVTAVLLCVAALLIFKSDVSFASLPLALFGILLFFSAHQDLDRLQERESDDGLLDYDFSQGYTSLEKAAARKRPARGMRQWLENRRAARLLRQQQIEEDEERRVDEVLVRLHERGRDALSHEDRALLDRVSARYRNRSRD